MCKQRKHPDGYLDWQKMPKNHQIKKISESQTGAGNQLSCYVVKFDPWDMLNNVCLCLCTKVIVYR